MTNLSPNMITYCSILPSSSAPTFAPRSCGAAHPDLPFPSPRRGSELETGIFPSFEQSALTFGTGGRPTSDRRGPWGWGEERSAYGLSSSRTNPLARSCSFVLALDGPTAGETKGASATAGRMTKPEV